MRKKGRHGVTKESSLNNENKVWTMECKNEICYRFKGKVNNPQLLPAYVTF